MFQDNTVFVIGAGASQEFDFPVGWELMNTIKSNCKFRFDFGRLKEGPADVLRALQNRYPNDDAAVNARLRACGEINRAIDSSGSIDEFIDRNAHDPLIAEVGKLQIAYAIAKAEAKSKLRVDRSRGREELDWDKLDKTWLTPFTQILLSRVRANEIERIGENITIICFNYDRCIEFYLMEAIQRSFQNVSREDAFRIVRRMNIIHPYGTLGDLPVGMFGSGSGMVAFAPEVERMDLYEMSKSLVTWSETVTDQEMIKSIKRAIADARNIVFLGFAFASQNLELLNAAEFERPVGTKNVYATAVGFKPQVSSTIKEKIAELYTEISFDRITHSTIHIEHEEKCYDFMRTHMINLAR